MKTKALVLSGYGINCENETKYSIEKVGGEAEILHVNELIDSPHLLENFNFFVLPGGFSFGDDIGSGKVLANKLHYKLKDKVKQFIEDGKLVLGICNGFQVLAKLGILPMPDFTQRVTLTYNESGRFEDRWVFLKTNRKSPCIFTKSIEYMMLPVRHGEGRFVLNSDSIFEDLTSNNLHVLQYMGPGGKLSGYPYNPNGSVFNIAGICDGTGRIFGLMPHPEGFNIPENNPYWTSEKIKEPQGLKIFKNAVDYLASL